jgi:predicted dehydrogenase
VPDTPISLAFAGAGWVTVVHGLAAEAFDDVRVTRVASRRPDSAARRAVQVGAEPCRYDELPGDADAVVVATPPQAHRALTQRTVDAGALALVEAPLAATLADADAIVDMADRGQVAYGENLVHSPVVAETVSARRHIGDLTFLEVRLTQGRPEGGTARTSTTWGGGALFDLGVHAIAVALLLAAPARVTSVEQARIQRGSGLSVDDDATIVLGFDDGLRAQVRATWRAAAPMWEAQAASATGAVRLELVPEPSVDLNGRALGVPRPPTGLATDQLYHLGYLDQIAALATDVRTGRAPQVSPALGRHVLEIVCAAYASAASGAPETLPFTGRRDRTPLQLWGEQ